MAPISRDNWEDEGDEEAQLLQNESVENSGEAEPLLAHSKPDHAPSMRQRLWLWIWGPSPPQIQSIKPVFPALQRYPSLFLQRVARKRRHKLIALAVFLVAWAAAFFIPLAYTSRAVLVPGGQPHEYVVNLGCVDSLWQRKNFCGLDGIDCLPFSNASIAFRCPAHCAAIQVHNPRAVGPVEVNYRPLVIGGQDGVYRGDSFICGSALHAGIVSEAAGGCGRLSRVGQMTQFPSSTQNGIKSIPFDSYFPLAMEVSSEKQLRCPRDPRQPLLVVSVLFTAIFTALVSSTGLLFTVVSTAIFMHVALVSDPPRASHYAATALPDHLSSFAGRLLPAAFCGAIMYQTSVSKTLRKLDAPLEKVVLWLGGFWIGALSNYTFDWIPITRLTSHDLEQQPGAKLALVIIVLLIALIMGQQIYYLRKEGRLPRYLVMYGIFISAILACLVVPGLEFRLHHYVLGLLLLPGTGIQTRPSLLYQGILLGLFVNGTARWGFDSILQTAAALRNDATLDSLVPSILKDPLIEHTVNSTSILFKWELPPLTATFDGISVLVNDVERYRQQFASDNGDAARNFTWFRPAGLDLNEYFRFAFVSSGKALDYTRAGTWWANGTWQHMVE